MMIVMVLVFRISGSMGEGTEVRVTGRLEPWCEIVIADGKKGWVEQHKIEAI